MIAFGLEKKLVWEEIIMQRQREEKEQRERGNERKENGKERERKLAEMGEGAGKLSYCSHHWLTSTSCSRSFCL